MKKLKRSNSLIYSLSVIAIIFLNFGYAAHATEQDYIEAATNAANEVGVDITNTVTDNGPVVEISEYSLDSGYIAAGKESTVLLTLKNSNKNFEVNNLNITVRSESGLIYPQYGQDNLFYVGTIKPGSSTTLSVPVVVSSLFEGEYVDFICDFEYESAGRHMSNSSTMILPGQTEEPIVVNSLEVSAHAIKDSQSLLSIGYSNRGTDNINDAVIVVYGSISETTREIELGSIAAGKTYNKDCNIIFTESGNRNVSVILKYTDSTGERCQQDLGTFRVNVAEKNAPTITGQTTNPYLVLTGNCISLLAFVFAVILSFRYVKNH